MILKDALKHILKDPEVFSRCVIKRRPLRPYQLEPMRAILASAYGRQGHVFTVEFARQMGKNECSAQLECYLLNLFQRVGGNIVKAAPTFKPQVINSKMRLEGCLDNAWNRGRWRGHWSYIVQLGNASVFFFSGEAGSQVVGATANILLEIDEAQDFSETKYLKDFRPMGSTANVTTVLYGTAWTEDTLLEKQKQLNLDLERRDGVRRHFQYDWQVLADLSPEYHAYVEGERARLGEDHPLFKTQYKLELVSGTAGMFSPTQLAQMKGRLPRLEGPEPGGVRGGGGPTYAKGYTYVAGVDFAGEDEEAQDAALRALKPKKDSTVLMIGEVDFVTIAQGLSEPRVQVVRAYWWTGKPHRELYEQLLDLLLEVWGVVRVAADASGVGAGVASFLAQALGDRVDQVVFSAKSKSELGFGLLAAVNSGRFKFYQGDDEEAREFWFECEKAQSQVRAGVTMNFYVDPQDGHDDFLVAAALLVRAAGTVQRPPASAVVQAKQLYLDGLY